MCKLQIRTGRVPLSRAEGEVGCGPLGAESGWHNAWPANELSFSTHSDPTLTCSSPAKAVASPSPSGQTPGAWVTAPKFQHPQSQSNKVTWRPVLMKQQVASPPLRRAAPRAPARPSHPGQEPVGPTTQGRCTPTLRPGVGGLVRAALPLGIPREQGPPKGSALLQS